MRVIDLGKRTKASRITVLSYGGMRTGKTRFAATWPRPVFLSDATESGWTTIENMDKNALHEPDRLPLVWAIEKSADMFQAIKDVENMIRTKPGTIMTIVVDSLTFYADLFFNTLDAAGGGRVDPRQHYQKLGQHLRTLREQIHLLPLNVIWLALAKDPGEDNPIGQPMLPGQNAAKFAAGCDYVLYHRSFQPTPSTPLQWEIRTRKWQNYAAGGRDEGLLPDPLAYVAQGEQGDVYVPDCTYRTMAEMLGLNVPVAAATAPTPGNGKNLKGATAPSPATTAQPGRVSR
jgi:hypothetical protein